MTNEIPLQVQGAKSDNNYTLTCASKTEARAQYKVARKKLMDINSWNKICKNLLKAQFQLCNDSGQPVTRLPKVNDFFKIDLPGPGPINGNGFDWVQIKKIAVYNNPEQDAEGTSIVVKPAPCPLNDYKNTAHFFKSEATSTFMLKREKLVLTAEIHGRNEIPNNETDVVIDAIRNKLVANFAIKAFADIQWQELCKALLS